MPKLVLLRHGQSEWNAENRFTGWYDCNLTPAGETEARMAGKLLIEAKLIPDSVHTSLQTRAIRTTELVLEALEKPNIPVTQSWRLNERHYGDLTGLDKTATRKKFGDEQFFAWRRGYSTPPPPINKMNPYNPNTNPQYDNLPKGTVPLTECLADVVSRLLPYWENNIAKDLKIKKTVLVSAHGNSLRALCKHLDGIDDKTIVNLNIPTGIPFLYELDDQLQPLKSLPVLKRALDPKAAHLAAEEVNRQAN